MPVVAATFDPIRSTAKDRLRFRLDDFYPIDAEGALTDALLPDLIYETFLEENDDDEDAVYELLAPRVEAVRSERPTKKRVDDTELTWGNRGRSAASSTATLPTLGVGTIAASANRERLDETWPNWRDLDDETVE